MSVTASAVIASSLLAADGADATLNTDAQKFEAPWTVSLKHDLKVKEIDAEKVLKKRVVKAEKEESGNAEATGTYTIKSGDTLSEIAYKYGISTEDLMAWNNLESTLIIPGQELTLEGTASDTMYAENTEEETQVADASADAGASEQLEIVEVADAGSDEDVQVEEPAEVEVAEETTEPEEEVVEEEIVEEQVEEEVVEDDVEEAPETEDDAEVAIAEAEEDDAEAEEDDVEEASEESNNSQPSASSLNSNDNNAAAEQAEAEEAQEEQAEKERQEKAEQERKEREEQERQEQERQEQERLEQERKEKEEQERKEKEEREKQQQQEQQQQANAGGGDLISTAKSVMGTPYVWGGTSPSGFDCSGFIYWAHKQSGNDIGRTNVDGYYNRSQIVNNPQPGDLVFFENTYKSGISHMGIYLGGGQFIHAGSSTGVAITSVNNSYWSQHFHSYKRFY